MELRKKLMILSFVVTSIILVQNIALASAIAPPPDLPPPGGGTYTYDAFGYVKCGTTKIPYATVKLYTDTGTYLGSTTTNTNGYFYKTVTVSPNPVDFLKAVVSKSGYSTTFKYAAPDSNNDCNFGTIYLSTYYSYTVHGSVTLSDTEEPYIGGTVNLYKDSYGVWEFVDDATTNSVGYYSFSYSTGSPITSFKVTITPPTGYIEAVIIKDGTGSVFDMGTHEMILCLPNDNVLIYRDSCDCISRWIQVLNGENWDLGYGSLKDGTMYTTDGYLSTAIPWSDYNDWHGGRFYQHLLSPVAIQDIAALELDVETISDYASMMGKLFVDFYDSDGLLTLRLQIGDYSNVEYALWVAGSYYTKSGTSYMCAPEINTATWGGEVFFRYRDGVGFNFFGPQENLVSKEIRLVDESILAANNGEEKSRTIEHVVLSFMRWHYNDLTENRLHSIGIYRYGITTTNIQVWNLDASTNNLYESLKFDTTWQIEADSGLDYTMKPVCTRNIGDLVYHQAPPSYYHLWTDSFTTPNGFQGPCYTHIFAEAIFLEEFIEFSAEIGVELEPNHVGRSILVLFDQWKVPIASIMWEDTGSSGCIELSWFDDQGEIVSINTGGGEFTDSSINRDVCFYYDQSNNNIKSNNNGILLDIINRNYINSDRKIQFLTLQMGSNQLVKSDRVKLYSSQLVVKNNPVLKCSNPIIDKRVVYRADEVTSTRGLAVDIDYLFDMPDLEFVLGPARLIITGTKQTLSGSFSGTAFIFCPQNYEPTEPPYYESLSHFDIPLQSDSFTITIPLENDDLLWWDLCGTLSLNFLGIEADLSTIGEWCILAQIETHYVANNYFEHTIVESCMSRDNFYRYATSDPEKRWQEVITQIPSGYQDVNGYCTLVVEIDSAAAMDHLKVTVENQVVLDNIEVENGYNYFYIDISTIASCKDSLTIKYELLDGTLHDILISLKAYLKIWSRLWIAPDDEKIGDTSYQFWHEEHPIFTSGGPQYTIAPGGNCPDEWFGKNLFTLTCFARQMEGDDDLILHVGLDMVHDTYFSYLHGVKLEIAVMEYDELHTEIYNTPVAGVIECLMRDTDGSDFPSWPKLTIDMVSIFADYADWSGQGKAFLKLFDLLIGIGWTTETTWVTGLNPYAYFSYERPVLWFEDFGGTMRIPYETDSNKNYVIHINLKMNFGWGFEQISSYEFEYFSCA
ncbi:MAG: hypothetical protein JW779_13235 [Candidatus Thorarchaeota archaeon]|nr:hypothetical protein [Candidatus Thorarchaeota archaeon]